MNDPPSGEVVRVGGDGRAGRGAVWIPAPELLEESRAGGVMDRAVHATACPQRLVRGVPDGVDPLGRDVATHEVEPPIAEMDAVRHRRRMA